MSKEIWIPISEELPDKNKHVLLSLEDSEGNKAIVVGYLFFSEREDMKKYNNEFSVYNGDTMPNFLKKEFVLAWMSLPNQYTRIVKK